MLLKTGWILYLLTMKVFKDDVNLLANVTFPSQQTGHRTEIRLLFAGYTFPYKTLRDWPLEKLWGGGELLSRRNIFFVIKFIVWIFLGLIGVHEFFHLIFPCAKIFFCTSPPHSLPFPLIHFLMVLYTDQVQCMSHNSDLTFVTSVVQSSISCLFNTFLISLWIINHNGYIWPLAASHSRGTKRACRRAKVELGQEKQKTS